jgi:two-component system response regulator DctR
MNFSAQTTPQPYVVVVDDDPGMLRSIGFMLHAEKIRCLPFSGGEAFFEELQTRPELLQGPGCLLLDLRMPGMSGLEVFERLMQREPDPTLAIIFITAHGEVSIVARVLKQGAVDFIQKPFDAETMLRQLQDYFEISRKRFVRKAAKADVLSKINDLTDKEQIVMSLLFEGLSNKEIAEKLSNSVRTIELRRASVYDKLHVRSVVEMTRLLESIDWQADPAAAQGQGTGQIYRP